MIEIDMPKHWRWRPFIVDNRLEREAEFAYLFRNTYARTIPLPALRAAVYWPRPLHIPVRWAYRSYLMWLSAFVWPLARHVIGEGEAIWRPFRWVLDLFELAGPAPTVRYTRE